MSSTPKTRGRDGRVWVFLCAASLAIILVMMAAFGLLIGVNSFKALWPYPLEQVGLADGTVLLGQEVNRDLAPDGRVRVQYRVANRDLNNGADFRWVFEKDITSRTQPADAVRIDRVESGDFFGFFPGELLPRLAEYRTRWNAEAEPLRRRLAALGDAWRDANLKTLKAEYERKRAASPEAIRRWDAALADCRAQEEEVKVESGDALARFNRVKESLQGEKATFATAGGGEATLPLSAIVDAVWPNRLDVFGKIGRFAVNAWNLLSQYPREANTAGGLFPALFGTAMLVFIMAASAFPLGVAAGVYLGEYAGDGFLPRAARVAVNNLAGVPSIVYGIFGLGFFIYGVGGSIDALFFPERVAAGIGTFGGGGILWSSLTLGLLTLPVVVVATEEALSTVPSEVRQGSLALGATKFQTLVRVVLPMASPGILTGFILAMARAAGEVAPLMLTGAVKSAPGLPLDGTWPFLHLERKFMHLGFHIYDMGFQSPNVEAAKPMVYLTALVLLALVFFLNLAAISLRRRMRDRYAMRSF